MPISSVPTLVRMTSGRNYLAWVFLFQRIGHRADYIWEAILMRECFCSNPR